MPKNSNAEKLNKTWTIMVYMEGDNNLADEMIWALQLVQDTSIEDNLTLRMLFDSGGGLKELTRKGKRDTIGDTQPGVPRGGNGVAGGAVHQRLQLNDAPKFRVSRRKLPQMSPSRTGYPGKKPPKEEFEKVAAQRLPHILQAFIRDTVIAHQADHYMLILAGHGSGAVGDFLGSNQRSSNLSIHDLGRVLEEVEREFRQGPFAGQGGDYKGLDILGLDSCLMSMTEVAYEIRTSVDYLVGAEGFEPDNGWPYFRILERLNKLAIESKKQAASVKIGSKGKKPRDPLEPENVAKELARTYVANYLDYTSADISTDQSTLHLRRIGALKNALSALSDALQQEIDKDEVKDAIVLAHWEAQGYKNEDYTDLFDFCKCLVRRCEKIVPNPKEVLSACDVVMKTITGAPKGSNTEEISPLVLLSCYAGAAFQHSHGVSVFFPWSKVTDAAGISELDHYAKLKFAGDSKWDEFLRTYLARTQRGVRNGEDEVDPDNTKDPKIKGLKFEGSRLNHRRAVISGKPGRYDSEYDTLYDSEYDTLYDSEYDTLFGKNAKTITMKNGPVRWLPCKLAE